MIASLSLSLDLIFVHLLAWLRYEEALSPYISIICDPCRDFCLDRYIFYIEFRSLLSLWYTHTKKEAGSLVSLHKSDALQVSSIFVFLWYARLRERTYNQELRLISFILYTSRRCSQNKYVNARARSTEKEFILFHLCVFFHI